MFLHQNSRSASQLASYLFQAPNISKKLHYLQLKFALNYKNLQEISEKTFWKKSRRDHRNLF